MQTCNHGRTLHGKLRKEIHTGEHSKTGPENLKQPVQTKEHTKISDENQRQCGETPNNSRRSQEKQKKAIKNSEHSKSLHEKEKKVVQMPNNSGKSHENKITSVKTTEHNKTTKKQSKAVHIIEHSKLLPVKQKQEERNTEHTGMLHEKQRQSVQIAYHAETSHEKQRNTTKHRKTVHEKRLSVETTEHAKTLQENKRGSVQIGEHVNTSKVNHRQSRQSSECSNTSYENHRQVEKASQLCKTTRKNEGQPVQTTENSTTKQEDEPKSKETKSCKTVHEKHMQPIQTFDHRKTSHENQSQFTQTHEYTKTVHDKPKHPVQTMGHSKMPHGKQEKRDQNFEHSKTSPEKELVQISHESKTLHKNVKNTVQATQYTKTAHDKQRQAVQTSQHQGDLENVKEQVEDQSSSPVQQNQTTGFKSVDPVCQLQQDMYEAFSPQHLTMYEAISPIGQGPESPYMPNTQSLKQSSKAAYEAVIPRTGIENVTFEAVSCVQEIQNNAYDLEWQTEESGRELTSAVGLGKTDSVQYTHIPTELTEGYVHEPISPAQENTQAIVIYETVACNDSSVVPIDIESCDVYTESCDTPRDQETTNESLASLDFGVLNVESLPVVAREEICITEEQCSGPIPGNYNSSLVHFHDELVLTNNTYEVTYDEDVHVEKQGNSSAFSKSIGTISSSGMHSKIVVTPEKVPAVSTWVGSNHVGKTQSDTSVMADVRVSALPTSSVAPFVTSKSVKASTTEHTFVTESATGSAPTLDDGSVPFTDSDTIATLTAAGVSTLELSKVGTVPLTKANANDSNNEVMLFNNAQLDSPEWPEKAVGQRLEKLTCNFINEKKENEKDVVETQRIPYEGSETKSKKFKFRKSHQQKTGNKIKKKNIRNNSVHQLEKELVKLKCKYRLKKIEMELIKTKEKTGLKSNSKNMEELSEKSSNGVKFLENSNKVSSMLDENLAKACDTANEAEEGEVDGDVSSESQLLQNHDHEEDKRLQLLPKQNLERRHKPKLSVKQFGLRSSTSKSQKTCDKRSLSDSNITRDISLHLEFKIMEKNSSMIEPRECTGTNGTFSRSRPSNNAHSRTQSRSPESIYYHGTKRTILRSRSSDSRKKRRRQDPSAPAFPSDRSHTSSRDSRNRSRSRLRSSQGSRSNSTCSFSGQSLGNAGTTSVGCNNGWNQESARKGQFRSPHQAVHRRRPYDRPKPQQSGTFLRTPSQSSQRSIAKPNSTTIPTTVDKQISRY